MREGDLDDLHPYYDDLRGVTVNGWQPLAALPWNLETTQRIWSGAPSPLISWSLPSMLGPINVLATKIGRITVYEGVPADVGDPELLRFVRERASRNLALISRSWRSARPDWVVSHTPGSPCTGSPLVPATNRGCAGPRCCPDHAAADSLLASLPRLLGLFPLLDPIERSARYPGLDQAYEPIFLEFWRSGNVASERQMSERGLFHLVECLGREERSIAEAATQRMDIGWVGGPALELARDLVSHAEALNHQARMRSTTNYSGLSAFARELELGLPALVILKPEDRRRLGISSTFDARLPRMMAHAMRRDPSSTGSRPDMAVIERIARMLQPSPC